LAPFCYLGVQRFDYSITIIGYYFKKDAGFDYIESSEELFQYIGSGGVSVSIELTSQTKWEITYMRTAIPKVSALKLQSLKLTLWKALQKNLQRCKPITNGTAGQRVAARLFTIFRWDEALPAGPNGAENSPKQEHISGPFSKPPCRKFLLILRQISS